MRRLGFFVFVMLTIAGIVAAYGGDDNKNEFSLYVGYTYPKLDTTSNFAYNWEADTIYNVQELGTINLKADSGLFAGASYARFVAENVGIQVLVGYAKGDVPNDSSYNISLTWPGGSYSGSEGWTGTGDLTAFPICVNGIVRFSDGNLGGYISGGYTMLTFRIVADGTLALTALIDGTDTLDGFLIPLRISKYRHVHGMNVGGGFDFKLSPFAAITVDARYYYGKKEDLEWEWVEGRYPGIDTGILADIVGLDQYNEELTTPLTVDPSFFKICGGIKFFF